MAENSRLNNEMQNALHALRCILLDPWELTDEGYQKLLPKMKEVIDRSPYKFLQQHLDHALKKEQYELAAHIKQRMEFIEIMDGKKNSV